MQALKDVTLTIPAGMYGLLGPNGAGKSTLMRILATLQEPDEDSIRLGDTDVLNQKDEVRKTLGYLPQEFGELYRARWQIELFFKWIKQHLRIKRFFGTSANAVQTQLWIAISVDVLVAIVCKRLEIERDLYTLLQILSVHLFEKAPL